nr:HigA family addiction module antitoxin [Companilactobacillus halodurans]
MSKEVAYKDLIAFHPGSYVEDIINELNMTQEEFSKRLGVSAKTISKIISGKESISKDIANKLAKMTGISVKTWFNLQEKYDLEVIKIKNQQNEDKEIEVVNQIDFGYFKRNNLVDNQRYSVKEKIESLRKLLKLSNLTILEKFNSVVSYRNSKDFATKSIINSNVMLELAINKARNVTDNKYDKVKLKKYLPDIREMSLERPESFYKNLKKILLDCGIVLIPLAKLPNSNLNGATKKFRNGSVLLLITDKNKWSDIFWFSLVHELGHIYYGDFYSDSEKGKEYENKEQKADKFALDFFIPQNQYDDFVQGNDFSYDSVKKFAEQLKISPSIIVGRLQYDKYIGYQSLNGLRESYFIKMDDED